MKAVVLRSPRTLEFCEVDKPALLTDEHVLIKVEACGICGSDLRYWAGENPWALHTLGKAIANPPNIILGHEYSGVVTQVNSRRYEHLLGKRVGAQAFRTCGVCSFCTNGREHLCKKTIHMGHAQGWGKMSLYPGAYAEYAPAWGDLLYPLADSTSFAEAAMADIVCVAIHVFGRAHVPKGGKVLCIGGGPAGLSTAQVASLHGASEIVIIEKSPLAISVIRKYPGFNVVIPDAGREIESVVAALGSRRFDGIFDSVGTAQTIENYMPFLAESGAYVSLAVHDTLLNINPLLLGSERSFTTSANAFYTDVAEAYRLLNTKSIDVLPWITHRFGLGDYQKAFDLLLQSPKQGYKIVFEPQSNQA